LEHNTILISLKESAVKYTGYFLILNVSFLIYWKLTVLNCQTKYIPLALVTHNGTMIISFGSKETEKIWDGNRVAKLPLEVQTIGRRKLRMINNSQNIRDLTIPPSNYLEKLKGKLNDYHSIRINDQWRIIFKWDNGNASEVEIIDYH
jgi:proteic killer suppression protein